VAVTAALDQNAVPEDLLDVLPLNILIYHIEVDQEHIAAELSRKHVRELALQVQSLFKGPFALLDLDYQSVELQQHLLEARVVVLPVVSKAMTYIFGIYVYII
jgi:hypothetical protein